MQSNLRSFESRARRCLSTWAEDVQEVARETKKPPLSGRVHLVGISSAGIFIAHSLAARPSPPPITLLMHHSGLYEDYRKQRSRLSVNFNGLDDVRYGFDVEAFHNGAWRMMEKAPEGPSDNQSNKVDKLTNHAEEENAEGPIECLILTARPNGTEQILARLKHRLTPDSTVCIIQNGMGIIERLNTHIFPDPATRPNYVQGVFTHGLRQLYMYGVAHSTVGTLTLSPVVTDQTPSIHAETDTHWAPSTKYLLRLLSLTPSLVATVDTPAGLLVQQLERQVIQCIVQPMSALYDCQLGELLYVYNITRVIRLLLYEMSCVIYALPELQGVPGIEDRFAPERLRRLVTNFMAVSPDRTTSMLLDMHLRRVTEIEYLNGWFVRRGEELGIQCVLNYTLKHMVHAKRAITQRRESKSIPIDIENVIVTGDPAYDE